MKSKANIKPARKASDKEPASRPVYFLSLTVENVRCFGPQQTLDLSDGNGRPAQWTILLGDNGVGKTTLLQCLVGIRPVLSDHPFLDSPMVPKLAADYRNFLRWNPMRHKDAELYLSGSFLIGAKLADSGKGKGLNNFFLQMTNTGGNFSSVNHIVIKDEEVICFAYGATRRMGETSLSEAGEDDPTASLFDENAPLRNAEEWLLQADHAASKPSPVQKRAQERRDRIKEILIEILPDVTDIRFAQLSEKNMKPGVEFKTPYGWVSIKNLGLGYKTLILEFRQTSS